MEADVRGIRVEHTNPVAPPAQGPGQEDDDGTLAASALSADSDPRATEHAHTTSQSNYRETQKTVESGRHPIGACDVRGDNDTEGRVTAFSSSGGLIRRTFGSVTDKTAHRSTCPAPLIRTQPQPPAAS